MTLQGDFYDGHEEVATGGHADTSGDNLLGRWTRTLSEDSDFSLQSYVDQTHLADPIPPLVVNSLPFSPAGVLYDDLTTYDVDFQHRLRAGTRNQIVWGLGYRYSHDAVINAPALGFFPATLDQSLYSAFLQDEIALLKNLAFTVGTKLEHNHYTGFELEPNVRLSWALSSTQALWSAVSRAVRTPILIRAWMSC